MSTPTLRDLLQTGDVKQAETTARKRLEKNPTDVDSLATLAKISLEAGDTASARNTLSRVPPEGRKDYDVQLVEAMLQAQNGNIDSAKKTYADMTLSRPQRPEAHFGLGYVLFNTGDSKGAIAPLQAAATRGPDNWSHHFFLAGALLQNGGIEKGFEHLGRALELNPKEPQIYLAYVAGMQGAGQHDNAEALLREGLKINPNQVQLLLALSNVLVAKQDLEGALEVAQQARAAAPNAVAPKGEMARVLMALGRLDEALKVVNDIDSLGQSTVQTLMVKGMILEALDTPDLEGAVKAYAKAMQLDATDWAPANNLGLLLLQLSESNKARVPEAKKALEEAMRRTDGVEPRLNLAILLAREGQKAEAKPLAELVLRQAEDEALKAQAQKLLAMI